MAVENLLTILRLQELIWWRSAIVLMSSAWYRVKYSTDSIGDKYLRIPSSEWTLTCKLKTAMMALYG